MLSPRKLESVGFADVLYRSVIAGGSRRRTIVTRPRTPGRHPAVLFIGGLGCSWMEYTLENVRRQRALAGAPLDEVDVAVRDAEVCAHHFFVQQEQPEQVEAIGPACARMLRGFGNVPYTYMQQVGDISLARQWKQVDIPVLVIYGTSDALTSADESRYLVELINSFHPGRAMYQEVPGMAHGFTVYSSQKEFMTDKKPHPTDRKVLDLILGWAEEHAGRPP